MNRKLITSVALGAGLILISGAGQAKDAALKAGAPKTVRLNFVEHAASDTVIHTGGEGDKPGNLMVFNNAIYDAANSKEVGRSNGSCIRTVVGKMWECAFTNRFADSQISVSGTFQDVGVSIFTVTGGTGKFAGKQGEMRISPHNKDGSELNFAFTLVD